MSVTIDTKLRRLHDYWAGGAVGDRLPSRADLDPVQMRFILGNLLLVDVGGGVHRTLRFRLHGTNLAYRCGHDLTGWLLTEARELSSVSLPWEGFAEVARSGKPIFAIGGKRQPYEALVLPLAADGRNVDMLLTGLLYRDTVYVSNAKRHMACQLAPTSNAGGFEEYVL